MFIRFRENGSRLYVSLVRSRRVDGKVRSEHVAALGSVVPGGDLLAAVHDRAALWQRLHENIADLSASDQSRLMEAMHARIPIPTAEERGAAELAEAERDAAYWHMMHKNVTETINDHQYLAKTIEEKIANWLPLSKNAARNAEEAKAKAARLANYRGALD
jgi:hypothetical protein